MKSTGIVRKIDDLGRIVIPKELRKNMEMGPKEPVEIYVEGKKIILQKYQRGCIFCNEVNDVVEFQGKIICKSCLQEMKDNI